MGQRDIRIAHASLRYDAGAAAVADYLARLVKVDRLDLLTTTEAQQKDVARLTRQRLGSGWHVALKGEYLVAVRKAVVTPKRTSPLRLKKLADIPGLVDWMNPRLAIAGYTHVATKTDLLVTVAHMPSGVENGNYFRQDSASRARVLASRQGFASWGEYVKERQRKNASLVTLSNGDMNLDYRRKRWRDYLLETLGPVLIWGGDRMPKGGTHEGRVIDAAHVRCQVVSAYISGVKRPEKVDHRAAVAVIRLPEKK